MTRDPGHGDDRPTPPGDDALARELLPGLDDRPGPARRLSSVASAAMARAVVDAALADPALPSSGRPGRPARAAAPRRGLVWRRLAFAAALLMSLSVAAGAAALVMRWTFTRPKPIARPPVLHAPPPLREEPPSPSPVAPSFVIEMPDMDLSRPSRPPSHLAVRPPRPPEGKREEVVVPANAPPEDLLALANQHRRDQDWSGADRLYRAVGDRFPSSDAAVVAAIASATLHLEQLGDAPGALSGYQRALTARPAGVLAEEARWGIAEARRALGDRTAETAALRDFLEHHPGSALAPAARRREAVLAP